MKILIFSLVSVLSNALDHSATCKHAYTTGVKECDLYILKDNPALNTPKFTKFQARRKMILEREFNRCSDTWGNALYKCYYSGNGVSLSITTATLATILIAYI